MDDRERLEIAGDRLSAAMARLRGRAVSARKRLAEIDAELPEVVLAVALGVRDEAALGRLRRERSACEDAIADVDVVVPAFEKYHGRIAYAGPRIARGAPDALDGIALLLDGVSK